MNAPEPKTWINGKICSKADAKISVYDHGLLYGDGVFEGIRIYNGKIFKLKEHVERIYESAKSIALEVNMTQAAFADAVTDTVKASGIREGYIRPIVTRGIGDLGVDPIKCKDGPEIIIIVDTIQLYPKESYERGLDIITVPTTRNLTNSANPRIKSLNYLNNILAKMESRLAGCQEALMLNAKGELAECSGDNIFLVKNNILRTPPLEAGILEGITRNTVIEMAQQAGIEVQQIPLTRHDVYIADECFLTGTGAEIVPVIKCDGRAIGDGKPGAVTKQMMERYKKLTRE